MATVEATEKSLIEAIEAGKTVIVDFWASWCGPCKAFAPVFEATSEKFPDVVFAKVNTEEQPELAGGFQIQAIPTLMLFREKVMLFRESGALPPEALEDVLKQALALDMEQVRAEIDAQEKAEKN